MTLVEKIGTELFNEILVGKLTAYSFWSTKEECNKLKENDIVTFLERDTNELTGIYETGRKIIARITYIFDRVEDGENYRVYYCFEKEEIYPPLTKSEKFVLQYKGTYYTTEFRNLKRDKSFLSACNRGDMFLVGRGNRWKPKVYYYDNGLKEINEFLLSNDSLNILRRRK